MSDWWEVKLLKTIKYLTLGTSIFGLVTTLLVIAVLFGRKSRKSPSSFSLILLSVVDWSMMLRVIVTNIAFPQYKMLEVYPERHITECQVWVYFYNLFLLINPWVTVFITWERVFIIRFTFISTKNRNVMKAVMIMCIALFMGICIVFCFNVEIYELDPHGSFFIPALSEKYLGSPLCKLRGSYFIDKVYPILFQIFRFFLPMILLLIGNIIIHFELRQGLKRLKFLFQGKYFS